MALKWFWPLKKAFSCIKTKTNSNFAVKPVQNEQTLIFCLFDESRFSKICTVYDMTVEYIEFDWLCTYMKKVKSSQASISLNSCPKTQFFFVSIINNAIIEVRKIGTDLINQWLKRHWSWIYDPGLLLKNCKRFQYRHKETKLHKRTTYKF